jgi:hypothetical protein
MVGRGPEESGEVRVAADHPIERNHICRSGGRCRGTEIGVGQRDPGPVPEPIGFGGSDSEIGSRRVDVSRLGKAVVEEGMMDGAEPPPISSRVGAAGSGWCWMAARICFVVRSGPCR